MMAMLIVAMIAIRNRQDDGDDYDIAAADDGGHFDGNVNGNGDEHENGNVQVACNAKVDDCASDDHKVSGKDAGHANDNWQFVLPY